MGLLCLKILAFLAALGLIFTFIKSAASFNEGRGFGYALGAILCLLTSIAAFLFSIGYF